MDLKSGDSDVLSLTFNFINSFSKIFPFYSVNINLEFFFKYLKNKL